MMTAKEWDTVDEQRVEALAALSSTADPVLAELWSNEKDAAYDAA